MQENVPLPSFGRKKCYICFDNKELGMCKNDKEYYSEIGDGIFKRFPELIPAVGENYWRKDGAHKKMLLVAESNYFDDVSDAESVFRYPEEWYYGNSTTHLIPERKITSVKNWKYNTRSFKKVFEQANNFLLNNAISVPNGCQDEVSFYNYFLRPADADRKIKPNSLDLLKSGIAMSGVIEKLEPEFVIFLSHKSYESFMAYINSNKIQYEGIVFDFVVHPSSRWWNRSGGNYGRKKFETLLRKWL